MGNPSNKYYYTILDLVQEEGGEPGDLPKIDCLRNVPQNLLQKAPDFCHHGQIMIGGHWGL